jgi:hypothetical protein
MAEPRPINDQNDPQARNYRLAIAHGKHPVGPENKLVQHVIYPSGNDFQTSLTQSNGMGPWDACERMYYDGYLLETAEWAFHPGNETDTSDQFASDKHPNVSYNRARLPVGMGTDGSAPTKLVGIFRTLKTADYDNQGRQIKQDGSLVSASDNPLSHFFYKPNPANVVADYLLRWFKRSVARINWPAWVAWRDYCDELIYWETGEFIPKDVALFEEDGGAIPAGTYSVRVAAYKGSDVSAASDAVTITLSGPDGSGLNGALAVNWRAVEDVDGYRVYIGAQYWVVVGAASNTMARLNLTGGTAGSPPNAAAGVLRTQIPRFESHLFFLPPFKLSDVLLRIGQVSCMEFQDANRKLSFLSPADRASVFTIDTTKVQYKTFQTWQVDRKDRPKEIVVEYRDLDDEFLSPADPIRVKRDLLQGPVYTINGGSMRKTQAERVAYYWARVLCDMDQMVRVNVSPDLYHVITSDVASVSHPEVDWTNQKFKIIQKTEHGDTNLADTVQMQIYQNGLYSDTSHSPALRPLPSNRPNPYTAPPQAVSVTLTEIGQLLDDGTWDIGIHVAAQFAAYRGLGGQRGRVFIKKSAEADSAYTDVAIIRPDVTTLLGSADIRGVQKLTYNIKVVPESDFASAGIAGAITYSITLTGNIITPATPSSLTVTLQTNGTLEFKSATVTDTDLKSYEFTDPNNGNVIVQAALSNIYRYTPVKGEASIARRAYTRNNSRVRSATYATATYNVPTIAAVTPFTITFDGTSLIHSHGVSTAATFGGLYQISTSSNGLTGVIDTHASNKWSDSQLSTDPRSGTRYAHTLDKWGNLGTGASASYNVTMPTAPTLLVTLSPNSVSVRVTSTESASKRMTFLKTTLQVATDSLFSNIIITKEGAKPYPSAAVTISFNKPTGIRRLYVRAFFSDAFGDSTNYGVY